MKNDYDMNSSSNNSGLLFDLMQDPANQEEKTLRSICEIAKDNTRIIQEINEGMSGILELLLGPSNTERCVVSNAPFCLMRDMQAQAEDLVSILVKLNRITTALEL